MRLRSYRYAEHKRRLKVTRDQNPFSVGDFLLLRDAPGFRMRGRVVVVTAAGRDRSCRDHLGLSKWYVVVRDPARGDSLRFLWSEAPQLVELNITRGTK